MAWTAGRFGDCDRLIALMKLIGPIEFSDSVVSTRAKIDFFWRDDFAKQVSGYTLLGITVLSLLHGLLRKRGIGVIAWPLP